MQVQYRCPFAFGSTCHRRASCRRGGDQVAALEAELAESVAAEARAKTEIEEAEEAIAALQAKRHEQASTNNRVHTAHVLALATAVS